MSIEVIDYHAQALGNSSSLLDDSPMFQEFLASIIDYYQQQQEDFIWFCDNLLNIDLAVGWHLDFIGLILNQPRLLASFDTGVHFGFEGAYQAGTFGTLSDPNVGAPWYSSASVSPAKSKILSDDTYRRVLKARAIKNTSKLCSHAELLEVLNLLSGNTQSSIDTTSQGSLTIRCQDNEGLVSYFMSRLKTQTNILPIPMGVKVKLTGF